MYRGLPLPASTSRRGGSCALAHRTSHIKRPTNHLYFWTLGAGVHSDEYDTDASTDASDSGDDDDDDDDDGFFDDDVSGDAAAAGAGSSGNGVRQQRSDRGSTSVTVGRCRLIPVCHLRPVPG